MVLEKTLRIPWILRRSSQSILKEINPEYSLEVLIGKDFEAGKDQRQKEKGVVEGEMARWHHQLNGHKSEQTPGDSEDRGAWCAAVHGVTKC